jgi:acetyl-CoA acetyltransferase
VALIRDASAIVGIAQTEFAKTLEPSEQTLAAQTVLAACRDAGVDPGEIDGLVSYTIESTDDPILSRTIGTGDLTFFANMGYGGGAAPGCIGMLAMAVAAGRCNVGVAWRSRKRGSGGRPWANAGGGGMVSPLSAVSGEFTRPAGVIRPVDEVAMLTRRYMHETGVTREQLANVALACRRHANANPRAIMRDRKLTLDEYLSARWISEPLCLYDACLETDGALAVVMVSAERAKDLRPKPVYVHAAAQGMPARMVTSVNYFNDDPLRSPSRVCAPSLFRQSDISVDDIDVAQIYDAFSPLVLWTLEGFGFCEPGEGGSFVENGAIEVGGRLPVNTSGGSLSEAYVHGFNLVIEGVRQLRGESVNQVVNAETCLVTGSETVPTSAVILRR